MQTLLLPAACSAAEAPYVPYTQRISLWTLSLSLNPIANPSLPPSKSLGITHQSLPFPSPQSHDALSIRPSSLSFSTRAASSSISSGYTSPTEAAKIAQVAKRLEKTWRHFKRLGSLGLWIQLVCTVAAGLLLSFSVAVTGRITSHASFYATAGGIAAAFISAFFSLRYIQLSHKLKRTANDPIKAPPRSGVVQSLKNSIVTNILGMGLAMLGMQSLVGSLVAKALTTTPNPDFQGLLPPGSAPVRAIEVFLVQASVNAILSHFLGLVLSLELLRSVALPSPQKTKVPKLT